jgi:hypothetical protein
MFKIKFIVFALMILSLSCFSQAAKGYKFIEPNISITFDTTQIKITNTYSNSVYKKEAVDLVYYKDKSVSKVHISANQPLPQVPGEHFIDSFMMAGMKDMTRDLQKEIRIAAYDSVVRRIDSFHCAGIVFYHTKEKSYGINITCNHLSANDMTEFDYQSFTETSLETGYNRITTLLKGFKSYSLAAIQKEDDEIKKKYKVEIKKLENDSNVPAVPPHTFSGIVQISPTPTLLLFGIFIGDHVGQILFQPDKNNNIYITCNDPYDKGVIKKSGTLVFFNSFGKKVELPVSFEYTR